MCIFILIDHWYHNVIMLLFLSHFTSPDYGKITVNHALLLKCNSSSTTDVRQIESRWSCCGTSFFCSCVSESESDGDPCVCVSSLCLVPSLHPHGAGESDGRTCFLLPWKAQRKISFYHITSLYYIYRYYLIGSWSSPISLTTSGSGPENSRIKRNLNKSSWWNIDSL